MNSATPGLKPLEASQPDARAEARTCSEVHTTVDFMDGLAPAIAIKQKNQTRNPRSTVATATEIFDYLRLLYARCGTVTCLHCGGVVRRDTVDEIVTRVLGMPEGMRVYALFPVVRREIKLEAMAGSVVSDGEAEVAAPVKKAATKKIAKAAKGVPVVDPTEALKERRRQDRRVLYARVAAGVESGGAALCTG
jgi:excinuclease ABC subunit A